MLLGEKKNPGQTCFLLKKRPKKGESCGRKTGQIREEVRERKSASRKGTGRGGSKTKRYGLGKKNKKLPG